MPAAQIDPPLTTPNPQPNNFPCGVCRKNVNANHKAFCCDQCDLWVHIRCNYLNNKDYTNLQHDPEPFFCINCIKETIPHSNLTDNEIKPLLSKGIILPDNVDVNAFNAPHLEFNPILIILMLSYLKHPSLQMKVMTTMKRMYPPLTAITIPMRNFPKQNLIPPPHSQFSI